MPQYEMPPHIARIINEMRRDIRQLQHAVGKASIPFTVSEVGGSDLEDITTVAYSGIFRVSGKVQNRQLAVEVRLANPGGANVDMKLVYEDTGVTLNGSLLANITASGSNRFTLVGDTDDPPGSLIHVVLQAHRAAPGTTPEPSIKIISVYGTGAL